MFKLIVLNYADSKCTIMNITEKEMDFIYKDDSKIEEFCNSKGIEYKDSDCYFMAGAIEITIK